MLNDLKYLVMMGCKLALSAKYVLTFPEQEKSEKSIMQLPVIQERRRRLMDELCFLAALYSETIPRELRFPDDILRKGRCF